MRKFFFKIILLQLKECNKCTSLTFLMRTIEEQGGSSFSDGQLSSCELSLMHQEAMIARRKEEELKEQESRRLDDIISLCSNISRPSSSVPPNAYNFSMNTPTPSEESESNNHHKYRPSSQSTYKASSNVLKHIFL